MQPTFLTKLTSFQYDMWNVTPTNLHDWSALKAKVAKHGVRNSLLLAPMPTASTAQILGNNEGAEPYTSNIYTRRVLSGEFQVRLSFPLAWRSIAGQKMKARIGPPSKLDCLYSKKKCFQLKSGRFLTGFRAGPILSFPLL